MKLIPLLILFSFSVSAQTSKSVEQPEDKKGRNVEEQRVREEWDKEEQQARSIEEKKRRMDEERAENEEVMMRQKVQ